MKMAESIPFSDWVVCDVIVDWVVCSVLVDCRVVCGATVDTIAPC